LSFSSSSSVLPMRTPSGVCHQLAAFRTRIYRGRVLPTVSAHASSIRLRESAG
jgi:hypothetical protein